MDSQQHTNRHPAFDVVAVTADTPDPSRWSQEFWDSFWNRVDVKSDAILCWEWKRFRLRKGYGQVGHNYTLRRTHQLAWEMANNSSVPAGMTVLHLCDNPPCCNPNHLRLGTRQENIDDAKEKGRLGKPRTLELRAPNPTSPHARSELHGRAKLTDEDVRVIRLLHQGGAVRRAIARIYDVHHETINDICAYRTWVHVP